MKLIFYILAILAIALGLWNKELWHWYWYHTARLQMQRSDGYHTTIKGRCYTK